LGAVSVKVCHQEATYKDKGDNMTNVVDLGKEKMFPVEQELYTRIMELIFEYGGELSTVSVLGILDVCKDEVKYPDEELDD